MNKHRFKTKEVVIIYREKSPYINYSYLKSLNRYSKKRRKKESKVN